jgi:hypothetical protein
LEPSEEGEEAKADNSEDSDGSEDVAASFVQQENFHAMSAELLPEFFVQQRGSCHFPFPSAKACSAAAWKLQLSEVAALDDHAENAKQNAKGPVWFDPPYCYVEGGMLKFNKGGNFGDCNSVDRCVCGNSDSTTKAAIDALIKEAPEFAASHLKKKHGDLTMADALNHAEKIKDLFFIQKTQRCAYPITSLSDCSLVSWVLGLTSAGAMTDARAEEGGLWGHPPQCYIENGIPRFNAALDNTGNCTEFDQCICGWKETLLAELLMGDLANNATTESDAAAANA